MPTHHLYVDIQTDSTIASPCMFQYSWLQPSCVLQYHMITAVKFTQWLTPSTSPTALEYDLRLFPRLYKTIFRNKLELDTYMLIDINRHSKLYYNLEFIIAILEYKLLNKINIIHKIFIQLN